MAAVKQTGGALLQECCQIGHLTLRVTAGVNGLTWALFADGVTAGGKPIATGFVEDDLDGQFAAAGRMVSLVRYGASGELS